MQQTVNQDKYEIKYRKSDYTWPTEAIAEKLTFDETYMHIHLKDGRIVSVPLKWIPTLYNATPADREKYHIGWDGHVLTWDPDETAINEDLWLPSLLRYDEPEH